MLLRAAAFHAQFLLPRFQTELELCVAMTPVCVPPVLPPRCSSTPPVPGSRWRRGGRGHVEDGALPQRRADVVQVDAQQDKYGVEGEAETKGPEGGAVQAEAEPVDQPAGGDRDMFDFILIVL